MIELRASDLGDTHAIASAIAGLVRPRDLIILVGEMGAGKTTFINALLDKLGVKDFEGSPTYAIIQEYPVSNNGKIYHLNISGDNLNVLYSEETP